MDSNKQQETLSTEIVNRGVEGSGPYAGSHSFSVKVWQGMPGFLSSVDLKYVKLGYTYLIANGFYLLMIPPFLALSVFLAGIRKLTWDDDQEWYSPTSTDDITGTAITLIGTLGVIVYLYFNRLIPRSTYLIDFACFRPPNELKISKAEFIELAKNSGNFSETAIQFQNQVLKYSGIGDETYLPRSIFLPGKKMTLKEGREEAAMVIFGAVDNLIAMTGLRLEDIRILVVNCSTLNTTPSLSAMVINHYKLRNDIQSFNLGGMGCSAGVVAVDLAKDLLKTYPGSYALVVSTEVVNFTWYNGNETDMLLPNCFFRMGASALLLSNCRLDRWRAKYELKQLVRTHKGMDDQSYTSIHKTEDDEGKVGISVSSKDLSEVGGHALKANITTLGSLMLPFSEQLKFFVTLHITTLGSLMLPFSEQLKFFVTLLRIKTKPSIPNYKLAFEHICIQASSKKVLDELQKHLELTAEYMEAARKTLDRFGNTSSSSVWYELAFLEANARIKRGDRIWQIAFGSGFKCNSVVWKALRSAVRPRKSPWKENST